jgi:hypothetical protein
MSVTYKCRASDESMKCGFMPTSLDSRSHSRLRLRSLDSNEETNPSRIGGTHPNNSSIRVEGTKFEPAKARYAIGRISDDSPTMSLHPVHSYAVQALVNDAIIRDEEESPSTQSFLEKRKELINTYAPVKKQRQLRAAVNALVSDEKIEGFHEAVETMRDALIDQVKAEPSTETTGVMGQMRQLLPPFDLSATTPDAIYDFGALFPESLLTSLDVSGVDGVCAGVYKWINEDFPATCAEDDILKEVKSMNTIKQISRVFMSNRHEKKKGFAKLLNILISMLSLYKIKRKKNWTAWDIYATDTLAAKLGELYTFDGTIGGQVDRESANKLFSHICLFILRMTPSWEFDFSDLKTDLNCQAKEILSILGFCGIMVKSTANRAGIIGTLKAPLVVQTSFGSAARKGKGGKGSK